MGKKRSCHNKLITSRQLYRMISLNQDLPLEVVQDVISSLTEVVYLASSEGYKINIPKMGLIQGRMVKGHKKGDKKKISKVIYENTVNSDNEDNFYDKKYYEENGEYYCEYIEDEHDWYCPSFKFNRNFKQKCRERSVEKWEQ